MSTDNSIIIHCSKYTGKNKVNPASVILLAEMMLRHMGWGEAANLLLKEMSGDVVAKTASYDFELLMDDAILYQSD